MSKKFQLKERGTNEIVYPITTTDTVIDRDGTQLSDIIDDIPVVEEYLGEDVEEVYGVTREQLKKDLFIDMWNQACYASGWLRGPYGKYNKDTGYFELNGLTDITYEEAITIYDYYRKDIIRNTNYNGANSVYDSVLRLYNNESGKLPRTLIPPKVAYISGSTWLTYTNIYRGNTGIEQIALPVGNVNGSVNNVVSMAGAFNNCSSLKKVTNIINCGHFGDANIWDNTFAGCTALEYIRIERNRQNISFAQSPKLSYESLSYLISNSNNSAGTLSYTATVHPNVYSALTGEAEYPFNGGTQEEWQSLNDLAISKQITFATA